MGRFTTSRVFAFGALLFLLVVHAVKAQEKATRDWDWVDGSEKNHKWAELDTILREHHDWVFSGKVSGKRANLSGAFLFQAQLRGAFLNTADLAGADFEDADLSGAALNLTNLTNAKLTNTNMDGALLTRANLYNTLFEPVSLPDVRAVATANSLEFLTFENNPDALFQLRKSFADGGFREQERKITYALQRREAEIAKERCLSENTTEHRAILWSSDSILANCGSFILNRVFFDWTCQYGMSPGRPLSLGVLLWLLCSVLYFVCIHAPGKTGLYRVYAPSLQENSSVPQRVEEILPAEMKARGAGRFLEFFRREWAVFRASMFFSLMSAFNIGFRDINFGRWLRLLTRQEFDIKAVGWARVVAGWQSLISVYFIALWVLTYFGRPFG